MLSINSHQYTPKQTSRKTSSSFYKDIVGMERHQKMESSGDEFGEF